MRATVCDGVTLYYLLCMASYIYTICFFSSDLLLGERATHSTLLTATSSYISTSTSIVRTMRGANQASKLPAIILDGWSA